jgi:hypothetical protein
MFDDPIVEEIQKIREEYAQQFNYDLDAIYHDLKEQESRSSRTFVDRPVTSGEKPVPGYGDSEEQRAWNDPMVDEIHKIREAYLERFNYDMDAIYRDLKERERQSGRVIADRSQKRADQPGGSAEEAA